MQISDAMIEKMSYSWETMASLECHNSSYLVRGVSRGVKQVQDFFVVDLKTQEETHGMLALSYFSWLHSNIHWPLIIPYFLTYISNKVCPNTPWLFHGSQPSSCVPVSGMFAGG